MKMVRIFCFFAIPLLFLLSAPDSEAGDWRNKYRSSKGVECCGEEDCHILNDDDVVRDMGTYYKIFLKKSGKTYTVDRNSTHPSQDGRSWLCLNSTTDEARCYFYSYVGA